MNRIPLNALQKGIYNQFKISPSIVGCKTIPLYDDVPSNAKLPYITFGLFTCNSNGTKTNDITDVTIRLEVRSDYSGKKEVNEIAEDVVAILTASRPDLSQEEFTVISCSIDSFESFSEDESGYLGVISANYKIQNFKK